MKPFFYAALLIGVVLSGCGSGGSGSSTPPPIVGRWRQVQIADPTVTVNCPGFVPFADGSSNACGASDVLVFNQNGTMSATIDGVFQTGTYTQSGEALTVRIGAVEDAVVARFTNSNNTLTLFYSEDGIAFRDILERQ